MKAIANGDQSVGKKRKSTAPSEITRNVQNKVSPNLNTSISSVDEAHVSVSVPSTGNSQRSSSTLHKSSRKAKKSDPAQCLDIISRMYDNFYELEDVFPQVNYMSTQTDINYRMRSILVDWLLEVHYKFRLQPPTIFLCINLLDRYLAVEKINRVKLQLVGVASLLIACKFEEVIPPEVNDCIYITDNAYSKDDVLQMEQSILNALDYQLCVPTGYHFLTRYANLVNAPERIKHLSFYYFERNIQEVMYFNNKSSLFAAASLYVALAFQYHEDHRMGSVSDDGSEADGGSSIWPGQLIDETGYDESDLLPIAKSIAANVAMDPVTTSSRLLNAAKKKYGHDRYFNVSELPVPII